MNGITRIMWDECSIKRIDFMGYRVNKSSASFHHLVIPHRLKGPRSFWNGAILNKNTSHPYLHIIEQLDPEIFFLITSEMIDENVKREVDEENLFVIDELLSIFEREHCGDTYQNGSPLIREEFVKRYVKRTREIYQIG